MLRECDAADLMDEPDEPIPWMPLLGFDGFIIKGWSHLLSGYTRLGKTELITETLSQWLHDGQRILYFTEEPRGLWKQRIRKRFLDHNEVWPHGLQLVFALGVDPKELIYRLQTGNEPVVFIDTLRTLLQPYNENDNSELARLIVPWIGAARADDKTSIFVHHDRKSGGEHGRGISGGHALMAACDIAVEVVSVDGSETKRRVHSFARVYQPPDLEYDWEDGKIVRAQLVGQESNGLNSVQSRLLLLMNDEWQLTADLIRNLGDNKPSNEQVRRALVDLAERNKIVRDPAIDQEASGKAVRWKWCPPIVGFK